MPRWPDPPASVPEEPPAKLWRSRDLIEARFAFLTQYTRAAERAARDLDAKPPQRRQSRLRVAHGRCLHNRHLLANGGQCGCFYCLKTFDASEVTERVNECLTARCPHCGVDAALSAKSDPIHSWFLKRMQRFGLGLGSYRSLTSYDTRHRRLLIQSLLNSALANRPRKLQDKIGIGAIIPIWSRGRRMISNGVRAVIYLRVSRDDETTENQRLVLARVAGHRGWQTVQTYEYHGISGGKGRDQRPAFDAMLKDAVRRRYDILIIWSIDRLGRSCFMWQMP